MTGRELDLLKSELTTLEFRKTELETRIQRIETGGDFSTIERHLSGMSEFSVRYRGVSVDEDWPKGALVRLLSFYVHRDIQARLGMLGNVPDEL